MKLKKFIAFVSTVCICSSIQFSCGRNENELLNAKDTLFSEDGSVSSNSDEPLEKAYAEVYDRNGVPVISVDIGIKGQDFQFVSELPKDRLLTGKVLPMAQLNGFGPAEAKLTCLNKDCLKFEAKVTYAHRHATLLASLEVSVVEPEVPLGGLHSEYTLFAENASGRSWRAHKSLRAINGAIIVKSKIKGFTGLQTQQLSLELLESGQKVIRLARHGALRPVLKGLSNNQNVFLISGPAGFMPESIHFEIPSAGELKDLSKLVFSFAPSDEGASTAILNFKGPIPSAPAPAASDGPTVASSDPNTNLTHVIPSAHNHKSLPAATPSAITAKEESEAAP